MLRVSSSSGVLTAGALFLSFHCLDQRSQFDNETWFIRRVTLLVTNRSRRDDGAS